MTVNYEYFINIFLGISEPTFIEWSRIDDEEEQFLTIDRPGGRSKKTTPEDDQTLRALALENNWQDLSQLRQTAPFQENERLISVSNTTLRDRLSEQGKFENN